MVKSFAFSGAPVERTLTLKCLKDAKGKQKFVQTTATNETEAAAAAEAGIEMLIGGAPMLEAMRKGAPKAFITAGVHMWNYPGQDEILAQAFRLLEAGADAVYCPREPRIVEHLAKAKVPVMGHLGLVPRMASWTGGIRAIGRTADEALRLYQDFKDLENAGAVMVEAEVVAADVLSEIARRTSLTVVSLGSGPGGDVDYLFQEDLCGETETRPRHARAFGNLHRLHKQMQEERPAALKAYKSSVLDQSFPARSEIVGIDEDEFQTFLSKI